MASVTLCDNSVTLSKYNLDVHPRSDSTELIEAVPTTDLSINLTSCRFAFKNHVINYSETVYERNGRNLFWSIRKLN